MPLLWKEGGSFPKFILLPFLYIPCYYRTCISRRILSMSYKIPMKVAEIQLTYSNRVKAEDRPQITSSGTGGRIQHPCSQTGPTA